MLPFLPYLPILAEILNVVLVKGLVYIFFYLIVRTVVREHLKDMLVIAFDDIYIVKEAYLVVLERHLGGVVVGLRWAVLSSMSMLSLSQIVIRDFFEVAKCAVWGKR